MLEDKTYDAYVEGRVAYFDDLYILDNPYEADTAEGGAWEDGFLSAQFEDAFYDDLYYDDYFDEEDDSYGGTD